MADRVRDVLIRFDKAAKPWPLDDAGQPIPTWLPHFESWAARRELTAAEIFAQQQRVAQTTRVFNIRDPWPTYELTPDESFRLVDLSDGGRVYDLRAINKPAGRRAELDIHAEARAETVAA